jgi:hypothetical protein
MDAAERSDEGGLERDDFAGEESRYEVPLTDVTGGRDEA